MTISISASSFELTDAIRDYVERRLLPLSCSHPTILSAVVNLDCSEHNSKQRYSIHTQLDLDGRKTNQICHSLCLREGIDFAARELMAHIGAPPRAISATVA